MNKLRKFYKEKKRIIYNIRKEMKKIYPVGSTIFYKKWGGDNIATVHSYSEFDDSIIVINCKSSKIIHLSFYDVHGIWG